MKNLYKTQGIILMRSDFGEADRIVSLFTPTYGKITALAKGAQRPLSQFTGQLEPFNYLSLFLVSRKNLDILSQTKTLENFKKIREDLYKTSLGFYVCDLLSSLFPQGEKNYSIFRLLLSYLKTLEKRKLDLSILVHHFEVKLIDKLGFRPSLRECVFCGKKIKNLSEQAGENIFFSYKEGGVLDPSCRKVDPKSIRVSLRVIKFLHFLQKSDFPLKVRLKIEKETLEEADKILAHFLGLIAEREIKSKKFLGKVEKITKKEENKK